MSDEGLDKEIGADKELAEHFFNKFLGAHWTVSTGKYDAGELGIEIAGVCLQYYKWPDPMICTEKEWRAATKREFGEVIRVKED